MSYKIINILSTYDTFDITPLVSAIKWGGSIKEAARHLDVDMLFSDDYYIPKYVIPLGSVLILYDGNNTEIIRAINFGNSSNFEAVRGYDQLIYFLKNQDTKIFSGMTATNIIKQLCSDFSVATGNIVETGIVLDKIYRDKTLYDMCIDALAETEAKSGKKYYMRMSKGKLDVLEKTTQTVFWKIESGVNLSAADYAESIEDMKNKIIIRGEEDQVLAQVQNDEMITLFGVLQEVESSSSKSISEAQDIARIKLQELGKVDRTVNVNNALGINEVEAGTAISFRYDKLGFEGVFFVEEDEHIVSNGQHLMNLKLKLTDDVAVKIIKQAKSTSAKKTSANLNWSFDK